jgi:hypothetical protein
MSVVNGLWIGERLSALERACIQSFILRGHEFHLYVYEQIENVPSQARVFDASRIVPREQVFAHGSGVAKGSLATFSDLFRYELLYQLGGWWVDLDVFCLADTLPEGDVVIGRQDAQLINGAILHFPPRHPAMEAAIADARHRGCDVAWAEIGPELLTRFFDAGMLSVVLQPERVFYPIHFSQFWNVFDPRRTAHAAECMRTATCLHLWNEMIRRAGIDKNVLPPEGSLLRNLYEWTIGVDAFTHEYVLSPSCPDNSLALELIERRGG